MVDYAFHLCVQLTTVNGGEGLEEIGESAFYGRKSLQEITIHPTVKAIKDKAFVLCLQLMTVTGGKGLDWRGSILWMHIAMQDDDPSYHQGDHEMCIL